MRRRKPRAPRPIVTYDVTYVFYAGELTEFHFRLRCPKLLASHFSSSKPIIGDIATKNHAGKWSAFAYGAIPDLAEYMCRIIREAPVELVAHDGAKP